MEKVFQFLRDLEAKLPSNPFFTIVSKIRCWRVNGGGLVKYWKKLMSTEARVKASREAVTGNPRAIRTEDVQGAFYLLCLGHLLASLAFVGECGIWTVQKKNNEARMVFVGT